MLEFRRQVLESADSSNNVVKQALEAGEPEGLAIQARCQTGGYGRQGRGWSSPRGGMYLSLLLRPTVPPAQLPTLSLVTGLAVRDALRSLVCAEEARRITVKWPNDVVFCETEGLLGIVPDITAHGLSRPSICSNSLGSHESATDASCSCGTRSAEDLVSPVSARARSNGKTLDKRQLRKMCGISLESHAGGICIGIGVNVFPAASAGEAPVHGNRPLYLAELGYGHTCEQDAAVDAVADAVLAAFAARYERWLEEGFALFATDFADNDPLYGKRIQMVDVEGRPLVSGIAQGIDGSGNLRVLTETGLRPVSFGEAHLI